MNEYMYKISNKETRLELMKAITCFKVAPRQTT